MKTKFYFLVLLAIIGWSYVGAQIPTSGLVAWYPFNGNSNDESGNGNTGTVNGATLTNDRFGNANSAYHFDGNDYIVIGSSSSIDLRNNVSISVWIKTETADMTGPHQIVFRGDPQDAHDPYYICFDNGTLGFFRNVSTGYQVVGATFDGNILNTSDTYHIVGTYDSITGEMRVYLNGMLKNQITTFAYVNYPTSTFWNTIGSEEDGAPQNYYGVIDDVRIYNRALEQSEINLLYSECDLSLQVTPIYNSVPTNSIAQFVASSSNPTLAYQWQSDHADFGWNDIPTNSTYSGTSSSNLNINNVQLANHLQQFRVIATSGICSDTSDVAILSISDTCIVTVYDTIYNTITIYDSIAVTDTLIIDVTFTGVNPPNNINTLKVYPNPTKDKVYINTGNYALMSDYRIKIINSLGQTVFENLVTQPLFEVDISAFGALGLYYIQLYDDANQLIDVRKIILE
jgi:hypothetical protein